MTISRAPRRRATAVAGLLAFVVVAAACGSDSGSSADTAGETTAAPTTAAETTAAPTTEAATTTTEASGVTAEGISDERCQANKDAGKITFLTSFDFAAAASILDVVVAKDRGYFDKMCLDVELKPGFSTSNYPLVASDQAQFSSAGSYTEILNFSTGGAKFEAIADYGKIPIEALLVRDDGKITQLSDLKDKTIGVKGDLPPSIVAMLAAAGLQRGKDYKEVLLDGFDPEGAPGAADRRAARLQVERAGSARCRRDQVQAVRSRRRGHAGHVRALLHDPGLPLEAPDRRGGLRPCRVQGL